MKNAFCVVSAVLSTVVYQALSLSGGVTSVRHFFAGAGGFERCGDVTSTIVLEPVRAGVCVGAVCDVRSAEMTRGEGQAHERSQDDAENRIDVLEQFQRAQ